MSKKTAERILKLQVQTEDIEQEKDEIVREMGLKDWDEACHESMGILYKNMMGVRS